MPSAQHAAAKPLRAVLAWHVARFALKLGLAAMLAIFAGTLVEGDIFSVSALTAAIATLLLLAAAGVAADRSQAAAESAVAETIHGDIRARLENMPAREAQARPAGALVASLQRHPQALAALVVGHRAAATMLGIGPLLAALSILFVSWQAALVLAVASPVMIVFFVFVGGTIHSRAAAQEKAFGQLAAQFADRVRTLPTILASHGLGRERDKLEARMSAYAKSTMGVLMIAFLNAGIIDFFSSLSIAVLAVFLGLGHLGLLTIPGFSELALWQSLFILMLAPEFFSPFRRYAEQYHAKAEGEAAAAALDGFFGALEPQPDRQADLPDLDRFGPGSGFSLPARGLVAIVGESGAGKSTLLRRLAGIESCEGRPQDGPGSVDWIAADIAVEGGTLADALVWNRAPADRPRVQASAERVGLLDDRALPGGLEAQIAPGGDNLSGGQRLRIGTARALLSGRTIMADEPTAKLDRTNAGRVRQALLDCARERLVIVATHDATLADSAELVLDLDVAVPDMHEAAQ